MRLPHHYGELYHINTARGILPIILSHSSQPGWGDTSSGARCLGPGHNIEPLQLSRVSRLHSGYLGPASAVSGVYTTLSPLNTGSRPMNDECWTVSAVSAAQVAAITNFSALDGD